MDIRIRVLILILTVAMFVVIGPLLIFHAFGLRFDFSTFGIVKTGGINIRSDESGLVIKLNGKEINSWDRIFSGLLIDNLLPKKYALDITKDGFKPWHKDLTVLSGQVAETAKLKLIPNKEKMTHVHDGVSSFTIQRRQLVWQEYNGDFLLASTDNTDSALNLTQLFNYLKRGVMGFPGFVPIKETVMTDNTNQKFIKTASAAYLLDTKKMTLELASEELFTKPPRLYSPDGEKLASPAEHSVTIIASEKTKRFDSPLEDPITSVSWYKDSEHLFVAYGDKLYLLDAAGQEPYTQHKISDNVEKYAYDPILDRLYILTDGQLSYLPF